MQLNIQNPAKCRTWNSFQRGWHWQEGHSSTHLVALVCWPGYKSSHYRIPYRRSYLVEQRIAAESWAFGRFGLGPKRTIGWGSTRVEPDSTWGKILKQKLLLMQLQPAVPSPKKSQAILPTNGLAFCFFGVFSKGLGTSEGPKWPFNEFHPISPNSSSSRSSSSHFHSLSACFQINPQPWKFQPSTRKPIRHPTRKRPPPNPPPPRYAAPHQRRRSVISRIAQGASGLWLRTGLLGRLEC